MSETTWPGALVSLSRHSLRRRIRPAFGLCGWERWSSDRHFVYVAGSAGRQTGILFMRPGALVVRPAFCLCGWERWSSDRHFVYTAGSAGRQTGIRFMRLGALVSLSRHSLRRRIRPAFGLCGWERWSSDRHSVYAAGSVTLFLICFT
jgi:hypothetical protein